MEKRKKVNQNVFENIFIAVAVMLYFIIINFTYYRIEENILSVILKVVSIVILLLAIIIFEVAYKKDSGKLAIHGIEVLVLAAHALSIIYVVELEKLEFTTYILISSYAFSIYYILKAVIIHTIEAKKYLESLSDIKEIVNDKPVKKEAKKRKNKKEA